MDSRRRQAKIRQLAQRDGWSCSYCNVKLSVDGDGEQPTLDHVIPLSRGGARLNDNLVLSCAACNVAKGSKLLVPEFAFAMQVVERCRHQSAAAFCLNCARP